MNRMPPNDSGVRFENQGEEFGAPPTRSGGFDMSDKLVTWGLVASRQEAQYVLIAIAVVIFIVAGYFLFSGGESAPPLLPQ